jgi:preprotein translocase subunit SecG
MNTLFINLVMLIQVLSALIIVGLVLLQHGKGADMGAAFGSGASGSLFGASGSSNFMSKSTGVAAAVFFAATLALTYMSSNRHAAISGGALDSLPVQTAPAASSAPAASAPAASAPAASAPAAAAPAASAPTASADQGAKTAPASAPAANQIPK